MAKTTRFVNNKLIILTIVGVIALLGLGFFNFPNKPKNTITGVPNEVNKFLQSTDISSLKEKGATIYTGDTPPNIEGSYILDSQRSTYNSDGEDTGGIGNYRIQLYDQKKDTISKKSSSLESSDLIRGEGAFISGKSNCFTVFAEEKGIAGDDCTYRVSTIISGCITEKGIQDYERSSIMKYKDNSVTCEEDMMPVGNMRIIEEEDKLAEKK